MICSVETDGKSVTYPLFQVKVSSPSHSYLHVPLTRVSNILTAFFSCQGIIFMIFCRFHINFGKFAFTCK